MSLGILPLIVICGLNALIGFYVLRNNPRSVPNRSFAFFAFSLACWTLWVASAHNINSHSTFFVRAAFSAASVMVFALLLLFRTFPDSTALRLDWSLLLFSSGAISLSVLSFTPLIVSHATLVPSGLQVRYGTLHSLYGLYIYSCFATSILFLARKYRASTGLVRLQFNYLLLALLVPGLGVTITNLLLPLIIGRSSTGQYGPYLAVVFLGFTAHVLIHYRFMDIRLVLRQGMTLALAFLGAILVLVAISVVGLLFFPLDIQRSHVALLILGSILVSVAFPLLKNFLGTLLDRYVYRQDIDYAKTLHDASQALVAILDLDQLAAYTTGATVRALRSETATLYLSGVGSFQRHSHQQGGVLVTRTMSAPSSVASGSSIVSFLTNTTEPLVAEELPQRFTERNRQLLQSELQNARWGLVVPIRADNVLVGFLAVGPKLSADPFFPDELEFVEILSNQVGIAVRNAELYKQIVLVNEYIENILGAMDSGVIAIDGTRNITLCNKAAERLTGVSVKLLRDVGVEHLPAALWGPLTETLADGTARTQIESALTGDADKVTPIVCSTSSLRDKTGTILGAVVVFSDLTKVKDLEREKRRSERLSAFGALASGIAHEIKNPLVAIRTFAELLPERFREVDFREGFSKVVVTEIDRIDDLVDRLRGIAAPTAPRQAGTMTDIRVPIADTLLLLRNQLEQAKIRVNSDAVDSEPYVGVDDAQLKQLFLNLFLNAMEAMGSGGHLTIRIFRVQTGASRVTTEISDTGPGIPEAIKANVFDPFFTTKTRGSGLGLAICRGIVDAHQGSIRAENNFPRAGATIVVEFPWVPAPLQSAPTEALRH